MINFNDIKYERIDFDKVSVDITKLIDELSNCTDKDFINNIINFNKDSFEKCIEEKSKEDYEKYGKEKTLVMFKK